MYVSKDIVHSFYVACNDLRTSAPILGESNRPIFGGTLWGRRKLKKIQMYIYSIYSLERIIANICIRAINLIWVLRGCLGWCLIQRCEGNAWGVRWGLRWAKRGIIPAYARRSPRSIERRRLVMGLSNGILA